MNENPGETPNPLNPNPEPELGNNPPSGMEGNNSPSPTPVSGGQNFDSFSESGGEDIDASLANEAGSSVAGAMAAQNIASTSLDPTGREMQSAEEPEEEEKKKKKGGLIAGLIIALFLAVGCGVAALLIALNNGNCDRVAAAIQKIMSGNAPAEVIMDGTIDIAVNNDEIPISNMNIKLNSNLIEDFEHSAIPNSSSAEVTLTLQDNSNISFEFDEVYTIDGDIYFKVDGVKTAISNLSLLNTMNSSNKKQVTTNCETDENGETNCVETVYEEEVIEDCITDGDENCIAEIESDEIATIFDPATLSSLTSAIDLIDGEWLKISPNDLAMVQDETLNESPAKCISSFIDDINKQTAETAEFYSKFPFVISTNENIPIPSKKDPIYLVSLESNNFALFVNSMQNSKALNNLYSCLDLDGEVEIDVDEVEKAVSKIPDFYLEVNDTNDITRLYFDSVLEGGASIKADINFQYPEKVNVSEPEEYKNFSEVIQEFFTSVYE